MEKLRYTKCRKVHKPERAHVGDAGIDFYVPTDLTVNDLEISNSEANGIWVKEIPYNIPDSYMKGSVQVSVKDGFIETIYLPTNSRVSIPSGIRVLIEPLESMLQAANKSGIASKRGLIFGAEIVDSPYTGEVHISIINTSPSMAIIKAGEKIVQFVHVPVIQSIPEPISNSDFDKIASVWSTRGNNGMGSNHKDLNL